MPSGIEGSALMTGKSDIPQTWGAELARAEGILGDRGVLAPHQDAIELLSYLLHVPASLLVARPASPMGLADARMYDSWVARRAAGEALPHITGHLEFMGLDITVRLESPLVAPSAQRLVETVLHWARRSARDELLGAEIGTGCGAIALALAALEPRFTRMYAIDPSPPALEEARANGARYLLNLIINWREGKGLDVIPEPVDLIVCSQPCWIGLEQAMERLHPSGALLCAVEESQRSAATTLFTQGFSVEPVLEESQGDGYAIVVAYRSLDAEGTQVP